MKSDLARIQPHGKHAARIVAVAAQRRVLSFDRRKIEAFNEASDFARWMRTIEEKLGAPPYAVELTALINFESRLRVSTIPTARRASTDRGREHKL
jgi:hypothetical protein